MEFLDPFLIVGGIALAIAGAHLLVEGGVSVATRFGIPQLIIGSTVVAFGTSMPEFAVNASAAIENSTQLAIGNVLGSNIFNILFILGVLGIVTPLTINKDAAAKDFPMSALGALMIAVCGYTFYLDGIGQNQLYMSDGLIFLAFFGVFAFYTVRSAMQQSQLAGASPVEHAMPDSVEGHEHKHQSILKSTIYIIGGLILLMVGGEMIVDGAQDLATTWGMTEKAVGLLIVGPGTSVPEFIASAVAASKKRVDLVIGNVVGSNIFNVFFTLGITSIIKPIPLIDGMQWSILAHLIAAVLLMVFAYTGRKRQIGRVKGLIFVSLYVAFLALSFMI